MKSYFILFYTTMAFGFCLAQKLIPVDTIALNINGKITDFGADDFHSVYYILNSTELNKLDLKTAKKSNFTNHTVLEDLNTQNVLQISLKSGFFNLLLLDNQLNLLQDPIALFEDSNFSPTLTAVVDTNYLWGYDPVIQRLILWNFRERNIYRQSVILTDKATDGYFSDLIYDKGKVYLIGINKILEFDEYANLNRFIAINPEFEQIQIKDQSVYYSIKGELFKLNLISETIEEIEVISGFDYFSTNTTDLFVLKDKLIYIYKHQKP